MDKKAFRKTALARRSAVFSSGEEKKSADRKICENLISSGLLDGISTVLTYISVGHEAGTSGIIDYLLAQGITVAVPRCRKNGQMDFLRIESMTELKASSMGIPEPEYIEENKVKDFSDTLCLVPRMAFDMTGNRTGYGGGYYDRFLDSHTEVVSAGLCYQSLIYDAVPCEPHDKSVEYIITEKGIIKING